MTDEEIQRMIDAQILDQLSYASQIRCRRTLLLLALSLPSMRRAQEGHPSS